MKAVKTILVNFPSNIGDVMLTMPAFEKVAQNYPNAKITAICKDNLKDILMTHYRVDEVVGYNKRWRFLKKVKICRQLFGKFDLIIDFKNSALPFILNISLRTPVIRSFHKDVHSKDRFLKIVEKFSSKELADKEKNFEIAPEIKDKWQKRLGSSKLVALATASLSNIKSYPKESLLSLIKCLGENFSVVLLGSKDDKKYYKQCAHETKVIDLSGETELLELICILKHHTKVLVCVDSGIMHLASYLNIPIVALFGPTESVNYGPWSENSKVLTADVNCRPCNQPQCDYNWQCMRSLECGKVACELKKMFSDE